MGRAADERRRSAGTPSMQDVADHAGVAIGTVSNVLNRPDRVSEKTRRKVEAAIVELGFVRNSVARSLAVGGSNLVGLVLVDIGNSFFVDIARGVEAAAARAGLNILLANSDVDRERQDGFLNLFDEARAAGLILAPLDGPLTAAHTVQGHGRPVVLVNAPSADKKLCCVMVNDQLGGQLAAQHLIDQGCSRLAYVGGPLRLRAVKNRLTGARKVATKAGLTIAMHETHSLQARQGRTAALTMLTAKEPIDGIICSSDALAIGVIGAADQLGIGVPDELAVIGYDDNHLAADTVIPVSTIGQPGRQMGELATELLLAELHGQNHRHQTVLTEPHLIVRRSSQRAAPA